MHKIVVFIIFLTSSALSLSAQEKETRALSDFSMISVGEAISLTLIPGNKNEAHIKVRHIDLDDVETNVIRDRLKIELRGNNHRNIDVEVILIYKSIDALSVSSAADVVTKGPIKSASIDIVVSSAADANLDIVADKIDVEVSSAGDLTISGKTVSQRVSVSSAADYDGYDLECDDSYVRVSSAGSARINAAKKIDAKASSGGSIRYKGDPDKVYVNSSSGGDVIKSH